MSEPLPPRERVILCGGPLDGTQCTVSNEKVVALKVNEYHQTLVYRRADRRVHERTVFEWSDDDA